MPDPKPTADDMTRFRRMVLEHLHRCAIEARDEHAHVATTPQSAALAALGILAESCAYSIGSSLASNSVDHATANLAGNNLIDGIARKFLEGFHNPGGGILL